MLPPDPFCMAADNADYVQNTGKPAKAGPVLRMAFDFSGSSHQTWDSRVGADTPTLFR